jgi:hypothetical protein
MARKSVVGHELNSSLTKNSSRRAKRRARLNLTLCGQAGQLDSKNDMKLELLLSSIEIIVAVVPFGLNFWHSRRTAVSAIRPIVVFLYDIDRGWHVRNVGDGPALKVVVARRRAGGD